MTEYDVGDPEAVDAAQKIAKFKLTGEQEDLRTVLKTEEGRRVIWNVIAKTGPMHLSYSPGGTADEFFFREGRRSIGLHLIAQIERANPGVYLVMQKENTEHE